jgi:hypothetical protein
MEDTVGYSYDLHLVDFLFFLQQDHSVLTILVNWLSSLLKARILKLLIPMVSKLKNWVLYFSLFIRRHREQKSLYL